MKAWTLLLLIVPAVVVSCGYSWAATARRGSARHTRDRFGAIKARYDLTDLFRPNQNISPEAAR